MMFSVAREQRSEGQLRRHNPSWMTQGRFEMLKGMDEKSVLLADDFWQEIINWIELTLWIMTIPLRLKSLVLEFATLSRLLGDPTYESYARNATRSVWRLRNATTNLLSNDIDIDTGKWSGNMSGLGAGMDSFYEYLLKAYIVFHQVTTITDFCKRKRSGFLIQQSTNFPYKNSLFDQVFWTFSRTKPTRVVK